jgi:hypothetical protein
MGQKHWNYRSNVFRRSESPELRVGFDRILNVERRYCDNFNAFRPAVDLLFRIIYMAYWRGELLIICKFNVTNQYELFAYL